MKYFEKTTGSNKRRIAKKNTEGGQDIPYGISGSEEGFAVNLPLQSLRCSNSLIKSL
ncbi:hypothetical protein [Faecalicatena orotica]|uniref:hypothetical protein n=1 Tax=Faecalicatena orotica TaxID=1544 RepID=UPI0032164DEF